MPKLSYDEKMKRRRQRKEKEADFRTKESINFFNKQMRIVKNISQAFSFFRNKND